MWRGSPKLGEEVLDQDGKQKVWGKMNRRELVIKKTGLKGVPLKGVHIEKEGPNRQSYGERSGTLSGKPHLRVPL